MGTIKLNKDELLRMAGELSSLKEEVNNILIKTQNTENVLRRETSVSTYSQKRKLSDMQDLAYNLVREFEKISDSFYAAARAYDSSEDKLNSIVNINNSINIAGISAISNMKDLTIAENKNYSNSENNFEKLKELAKQGWSILQGYFEKKIEAVDFLANICDTINSKIDGYLENNKEFIAEFNAEHPRLSILFKPLEQTLGMFDGALMFVKEMTFGLAGSVLGMISNEYHGLLEDPLKTLKENGQNLYTIASILLPVTDEQKEIQRNVINGIWQAVKESINTNITNGDAYTSSRYITDVALNIASIFFGVGELKAASGVKKADNIIDGVKVIDKVSDVEKLTNGEKWFNYFNKTYGVENVEWTSKVLEGKGALRERVFANIEKSKLAREKSVFSKDIDVFHLKYKYNMINNPGPLSNFRGNPASNFLGGRYNLKILEEDTILYRSGKRGGLTIPGKEQNALGQWFTREPADSAIKVRIDSAVKSQWIDPKTQVLTGTSPLESTYSIKIPKGTTIYEGPVGYQGECYLGGENCNQIFILEPWKIRGVEPIKEIPLD